MGIGSRRRRSGFTLVELGVVILIIGIMMSFLFVASWEGINRANERATQALIVKLDNAIADRIEALTSQRPEPNNAHRLLAMTLVNPAADWRNSVLAESDPRARLIAKIDYLKRELPDVFHVQNDPNYPLNFAGMPFKPNVMYPNPTAAPRFLGPAYAPYVLPLGHAMQINHLYDTETRTFTELPSPIKALGDVSGLDTPPGQPRFSSPAGGEGIFGASYGARGSINRLLGYPPRGYNGVDDDGNGLIDELTVSEFYRDGDPAAAAFPQLQADIIARLERHQHITARSEMLYAILVGGVGPLGSVFSADDFTDREVGDTDGDGLPEFLDAWGKPLQFYRWPIYFIPDYPATRRGLQKGDAPYTAGDLTEPRDENPLDPGQLLISPAWWALPGANLPDTSAQMSDRANLFQQYFFSLVDPYADDTNNGGRNLPFDRLGFLWDRTHYYKRRAYFSKHLILSAGPDGQYGVGSYGLTYTEGGQTSFPVGSQAGWPDINASANNAARMILVENQAARSDAQARTDRPFSVEGQAGSGTIGTAYASTRMGLYQLPVVVHSDRDVPSIDATDALRDRWGVDDLTNYTIRSTGSGGR